MENFAEFNKNNKYNKFSKLELEIEKTKSPEKEIEVIEIEEREFFSKIKKIAGNIFHFATKKISKKPCE